MDRQNVKASHLLRGVKHQQQVTFQPWTTKGGDVEKKGGGGGGEGGGGQALGEQWSRREVIRDRTSSQCCRLTSAALTRL